MKDNMKPARPSMAVVSQSTEQINRTVLYAIAEASRRYPAEIPLPTVEVDEALAKVVGLLAQQGIVRTSGQAIALTTAGRQAVQRACRIDRRVDKFLEDGSLPDEETGASLLILAILQAHAASRRS